MKMIVIEESTFDRIFDEVVSDLELVKLREYHRIGVTGAQFEELHRKFHYEVHMLKDRLKAAR